MRHFNGKKRCNHDEFVHSRSNSFDHKTRCMQYLGERPDLFFRSDHIDLWIAQPGPLFRLSSHMRF